MAVMEVRQGQPAPSLLGHQGASATGEAVRKEVGWGQQGMQIQERQH